MNQRENGESEERSFKPVRRGGKTAVILIGLVAGVCLILWGNHVSHEKSPAPVTDRQPEGGKGEIPGMEEYRDDLERRIGEACSHVAGVGEVHVIVHLTGGFEYVYACDRKLTAGGDSQTYVLVGSGSRESPVYITIRAPAVSGIGIVCTGGNDPTVKREVTALLSAVFGVSSHTIYVTAGK